MKNILCSIHLTDADYQTLLEKYDDAGIQALFEKSGNRAVDIEIDNINMFKPMIHTDEESA